MDVPCIRVGLLPLIFVVTYVTCFSCANSDIAKDREECTEQLAGLATCLPYVEGNAKAPTPDCCSGLKQVLKANKKCLCVIIRDRNDPQLGLTINATLALGLPSVCNAPANVSKCPALLHLAPNSTEAQVFYQFGHASNSSTTAGNPTSGPVASAKGDAASANVTGKSSPGKSDGHCSAKRWLGFEAIVSGFSVWLFTSELFMMIM